MWMANRDEGPIILYNNCQKYLCSGGLRGRQTAKLVDDKGKTVQEKGDAMSAGDGQE